MAIQTVQWRAGKSIPYGERSSQSGLVQVELPHPGITLSIVEKTRAGVGSTGLDSSRSHRRLHDLEQMTLGCSSLPVCSIVSTETAELLFSPSASKSWCIRGERRLWAGWRPSPYRGPAVSRAPGGLAGAGGLEEAVFRT